MNESSEICKKAQKTSKWTFEPLLYIYIYIYSKISKTSLHRLETLEENRDLVDLTGL